MHLRATTAQRPVDKIGGIKRKTIYLSTAVGDMSNLPKCVTSGPSTQPHTLKFHNTLILNKFLYLSTENNNAYYYY